MYASGDAKRVIRSADLQALGREIVPPPLRADRASEHTRVTSRLRIATAVASQLRCREELLLAERRGARAGWARIDTGRVVHVEPLGDAILALEPRVIVAVLDPKRNAADSLPLEGARRLEKQMRGEPEMRTELLTYYGFADRQPLGAIKPLRPHVRLALHVAADATFAPYACGIHNASRFRQATLRIDVLSVSRAIWIWATAHRGLARSLHASRLSENGSVIAFPSFVDAYERALRYQLEIGVPTEDLGTKIEAAAAELGSIATDAIVYSSDPGRTGDGNVALHALRYLVDSHPDWLPDELETSAEDRFAIGAADLVTQALSGVRSPAETADMLDEIAAELRLVQRERGGS